MQQPMALFAMTRFSASALYLMAAIYIFLSAYVLFGGWRLPTDRVRTRLIWFLLLPIALFISLWFSGRWIWALFWWVFVFGDAGPVEEYARLSSGIVAIVISAMAFSRLALSRINRRYLPVTSWGTAVLSTLLLTVLTHEFTYRIYGWSARGAAENYFANYRSMDPKCLKQIEEVPTDKSADLKSRVRTFLLYCGEEPQWRVYVAPYGAFWWTIGGSSNAPDELEKYKKSEVKQNKNQNVLL
jgi:hypothetical protein